MLAAGLSGFNGPRSLASRNVCHAVRRSTRATPNCAKLLYNPRPRGTNDMTSLYIGTVAALLLALPARAATNPVDEASGDEVERSYIGSWDGRGCNDSNGWQCVHLELFFDFRIPW